MTTSFPALVKKELARARKNYAPMASLHEAYAVILEEIHELWDEIRKKPHQRSARAIHSELIQIAAMAQRTYEDIVPANLPNTETKP